jgi:hypothetical protein
MSFAPDFGVAADFDFFFGIGALLVRRSLSRPAPASQAAQAVQAEIRKLIWALWRYRAALQLGSPPL